MSRDGWVSQYVSEPLTRVKAMKTFFREYSLITAFILVAMIGYLHLGEHQRELGIALELAKYSFPSSIQWNWREGKRIVSDFS